MQMKEVREIIRLVSQSNLSIFEMENDGFKMRLEKNGEQTVSDNVLQDTESTETNQMIQVQDTTEAILQKNESTAVPAPLVGVFYEAANPGNPPFVKEGDRVKKGDVLCILEAMKVMNEIVAPQDGVILQRLVQNEQLVEYGQILFEMA